MDKLQSLNENIKKLEKEAKATRKLFRELPPELPEANSICYHNSKSYGEFSFTYYANTMEEILKLIEIWWPYILPMQLTKGTFTSFYASGHFGDERNIKTTQDVFPVTAKVSHNNFKFEAYAMVNGHFLNLDFGSAFRTEHNFRQYAYVSYETTISYGEKYVKSCYLHQEGFSQCEQIKWGSGGPQYPNDYTLYWTPDHTLETIFREQNSPGS